MSLEQAYSLALAAQGRLNKETARPDRNLRIIVGHLRHYESLRLRILDIEESRDAARRRRHLSRAAGTYDVVDDDADHQHIEEHHDADDDLTASEDEYDEFEYYEGADVFDDDDAADDGLSLARFPSSAACPRAPPPPYSALPSPSASSSPEPDHAVLSAPPDLEHDLDSASDSESLASPCSSGPPSPTLAAVALARDDHLPHAPLDHDPHEQHAHQAQQALAALYAAHAVYAGVAKKAAPVVAVTEVSADADDGRASSAPAALGVGALVGFGLVQRVWNAVGGGIVA